MMENIRKHTPKLDSKHISLVENYLGYFLN